MNKYFKRKKNGSIVLLILGALMIIFNKKADFIFGPLLIMWIGIILFVMGVAGLSRLYFHGDI